MASPDFTPSSEIDDWQKSSAKAGPLFKWAGGKQRFLWENRDVFPSFDGTYYEPFAGGLSVFFHLCGRSPEPFTARLSDTNLRLIRTYQSIKKDWAAVADQLRQLEAAYLTAADKQQFYFGLRQDHNRISPTADPARFLFLMRAGWNGVYRVNQKGDFNVPHGFLKDTVNLPSEDELRAVAQLFSYAELRANSWESSLSDAKPGDFVFLDPPYYSETRSQLYVPVGSFSFEHHRRLADRLQELQRRGVDFVLTNSAHPKLIELYLERELDVREIDMHRSINSKTGERGSEKELIVTPGRRAKASIVEAELDLQIRFSE